MGDRIRFCGTCGTCWRAPLGVSCACARQLSSGTFAGLYGLFAELYFFLMDKDVKEPREVVCVGYDCRQLFGFDLDSRDVIHVT